MGGENWNKEVQVSQMESGSAGLTRYETRVNFYKDRVKNKLGETFDEIVKDKLLKGYKTFEEHDGKNSVHQVKAGDTLFGILKDFYKTQFNLDTVQAEKEAYLSLAYVTKDKSASTDILVNVDALELGWKVIIDSGVITVRDAGATTPSGVDRMDLRPRHVVDRSPSADSDATRTAGATQGEVMHQAVPGGSTAIQATVEVEPPLTVTLETDPEHIAALKERLTAFEGKYELNKEGNLISLKNGSYLPLSVQWNDSVKEWIIPRSDLKYEKPEEAFADLLTIHEAEKLWTQNISNAAPGEDPFYLGDPISNMGDSLKKDHLMYKSDWLDESVKLNSFIDKEKLLAHVNKLYKENVVPNKETQTPEPRPEESENGMKSREVIRDTLKGIPLDFTYTLINSTEISVKARVARESTKISWNEASKEWEFKFKEVPYGDSDLVYMVKQAYKLQISELEPKPATPKTEPSYREDFDSGTRW